MSSIGALSQALMAIAFAVPALIMSHRLWQVWRDPMAVEAGAWVNRGVGIFVMEFILTHAGVALAAVAIESQSAAVRWGAFFGLCAFYALFALAIALAFRSRALFYAFLWVIGGRFVALAIGISGDAASLLKAHAVAAAVLYFAMAVLSAFLPWPRFGITQEVADRSRMPGSSGLWVDQPHRAIGAATAYFLALGIVELALLSWIDPRAFR